MKKLLAATAVTGLAAATAIPALAATKTVKVGDNYFVRPANNATVSISKGSSLEFVWRGNAPHNVVKRSGPGAAFHSPVKIHGGTFTHRFTRAGTYKLVCTIHSGMKLTVKVS
ncbi:MAG: cupredoxin domain-containing protein [Solirubrobacteraceae bacterium]